ncbi:MAG: hypothetical protein Q7U53_02030 [Anaerolineaceae bacterium]|nr:hypothetical protein [Anaerolineaceae bacterium]
MKGKLRKIFQGMVVLVICLSLTGGLTESVQAATCTWNGSVSIDWTNPSNWTDCGVPGVSDAVVIPAATTYSPTIPTNLESFYDMASITIDSDATLTIMKSAGVNAATWTINGSLIANAADSPIYVNFNAGTGSGVVNNNGTITKLGDDNLFMYSTFNNSGDLIFQESGTSDGGVVLLRGGNHTGTFQGKYLFLGGDFAGETYNFNSGSAIQVAQLFAQSGTVNIEGSYSPPVSTSYLSVHPSEGTVTVNFKNGASVIRMAETTIINNGGKLTLEAQAYNYTMEKLFLEYGGELKVLGDLTVNNKFDWNAGKLSGATGKTTINTGTVFTMGASVYAQNDFTLDGHNLVNNAVANWNKRNLTLINSAVIDNNGTFNANATTTMSAGASESFINNGNFYKNTASTTTTMNVPFTNDGIVQVNAGSLVFQQGMDNGENTTINLGGGILDPGESLILETGDSLIGSGTLDSNLVNAGTVSPGTSPGIITVDGDYTQDSSGTLEIELDGTTPGSGYDQLVVTGAATLGGSLDVSLIPGFSPIAGQSFTIMTYASHTGEFDTENLPPLSGDLDWIVEYGSTALLLRIPSSIPIGSITGTISCAGSLSGSPYEVYVDLHTDPLTAPVDTVHISCGDVYRFDDLPDGSYYVGAWLDENESGGGPPDLDEPHAWYGAPDVIEISGGNTITEIDITLEAPFFIYLPLVVK